MDEEVSFSEVGSKGKGSKKKEKMKEESHVEDTQYKFFVDLRHEKEVLDLILKIQC